MTDWFCCKLNFWCILDTLIHAAEVRFSDHDWLIEELDKSTARSYICDKHDYLIIGDKVD